MNKKIVRGVKRKTQTPLFVFLALIFIVIALIIAIFSFFVKDDLEKQNNKNNININFDSSSKKESAGESSKTPSKVESSAPIKTVGFQTATVLAETKPVDKSYFNDCVFVGDSISLGLGLYKVLPPANVIAAQNVGLSQVANGDAVYVNKTKTLMRALEELKFKPKKIYVMLGSNGLPYYKNDDHIKYYQTLVSKLKEKQPDAKIILQSVTPITAKAEANYKANGKDFTNKKINEFNAKISNLAKENKVYYLDVKESLVDSKGFLDSKFVSTAAKADGVHFLKTGHESMYNYYKTHTVDGEIVVTKK